MLRSVRQASCGSKLPMVEPGKKPTRGNRRNFRRQVESGGEIGDHRIHRKPREVALKLHQFLLQEVARYVDRHIGLDGRGGASRMRALRLEPLPNSISAQPGGNSEAIAGALSCKMPSSQRVG